MVDDAASPPANPLVALPVPDRAAIVGNRLRQIFDEAAAEPIPDAFKELLRKLG